VAIHPVGSNWSGNYEYAAAKLHAPRTLGELGALVARSSALRALGSRHSFTAIADSADLVSVAELNGDVVLDQEASTVAVPAAITYAQLAEILNRQGFALHNLASLPHISVAGAVATATHGSGDTSGNLATAVVGLEMVCADGQVRFFARGQQGFDGMVVALGSLGVVTRVVLGIEPFYAVRQRVYEGLSWEALFDHYAEVTGRGESVSVFHRLGQRTEQVWVKSRMGEDSVGDQGRDLLDAAPADGPRNPVPGSDPANCTEQLGVPGPWSERLPHFRSGFTPSAGEEIQSELFVAREHAVAAIEALRELAHEIQPLLLISELRTMAADRLWLSPQYGQDTVGLHFTWRRQQAEVERVMGLIEAALEPFGARPHWGKVFTAKAVELERLYPRMNDFRALRQQLDPGGVFINSWLRERILEPS
jgi:xylitol oxidase